MTTGKTISGAVVRQRSAKKAKAKKAASKSIKTTALENEQVGSELLPENRTVTEATI
jgi:hypothetical protein